MSHFKLLEPTSCLHRSLQPRYLLIWKVTSKFGKQNFSTEADVEIETLTRWSSAELRGGLRLGVVEVVWPGTIADNNVQHKLNFRAQALTSIIDSYLFKYLP